MKEPSTDLLLEVCVNAARTAGQHALKNRHRRGDVAERFDHDVKLVMDSECQRIAEEIIHRAFPGHAILGEEGAIQADHLFEWIIDPIDGTANYTRDFPYWCCSVAVRRDGQTLAGCVFAPPLDDCYTATADGPARLNGEAISPAPIGSLADATFFTGLTKDIDLRALDFFRSLAPCVSKIRIIGAAAIDICHVACGRSDGYFEAGIYIWDVAAAGLVAERAGAACTCLPRPEPNGIRYLCTAPQIHEDALQYVNRHFPQPVDGPST